jgi:transposase-like protein
MTPPESITKNRVGRPRVSATPEQVLQRWNQGNSWRQIAKALGIGTATAMRLLDRFPHAVAASRTSFRDAPSVSRGRRNKP